MSGESFDEPTASFTPVWDPVWDDEAPSPPPAARLPTPEPIPPLSALVPLAGPRRVETRAEIEPPEERPPEERPHEKGRGRASRTLARIRALLSLFVVVVLSGVALAAGIALTALAIGLALRQVAGG